MTKRDTAAMRRVREERPYCRICGTVVNLHVHHICPRSRVQNDEPDNLVVLCAEHHSGVHNRTVDLGSYLSAEEQAKAVLLTGSLSLAQKLLYPTEQESKATSGVGWPE